MTNLLPDAEVSAAYIELRARVVALLRSLPESAGDRVVPHCPAWTVRELAAHLLGVPDD
ncbi:MAG: maleylpyruvate isomerase N-terminal domain-containing protein, partial [Actinomycetota bacterium]